MAIRKEMNVRKIPVMTANTPPPRPGPTYKNIMLYKFIYLSFIEHQYNIDKCKIALISFGLHS